MPAEKLVRDGRVRWRARYYDPSGKRHAKTFDAKAAADRFLATIQHSKITGSFVDPDRSRVTVGKEVDDWLASKLNLAPKTRDRYEQIIRAHIRPHWERVPLNKVTHADLQRWLAGVDAAPATVHKIHRVMSQILAYAVADDRLAKNPAAGISLPRVRQAEKRYLTHQQVHALAEATGPEYRLMVLSWPIPACVGARWPRCECTGLISCAAGRLSRSQ